jgi:hypothetical protein
MTEVDNTDPNSGHVTINSRMMEHFPGSLDRARRLVGCHSVWRVAFHHHQRHPGAARA